MFKRGTKMAGALGASVTLLFLAGVAGAAESSKAPEAKSTEASKSPLLEGAQAREDIAAARTPELDRQTRRDLSRDLGAQQKATVTSQAQGRESIQPHRESQWASKDPIRQLVQKERDYRRSQEGQRARTGELRREVQPKDSANKPSSKKEQMEARIAQLRTAERSGEFTRPPASYSDVGTPEMREQELEIAQEEIVAEPVEPIPYERYVQIYKASAKRYGFAKDWYVLAAVGKVESNHGENMGPSSAGAMGPMQFLPSTWKEYGIDGNEDGVANIMDPEDAIPAAAAYLEDGGAPDDWYAALYTYNRAGWYVRKVLGVAEGYRWLAKDDLVKPYI
jgi:soluble lytic murein transglycosylase-like protein